MPNSRHKSGGSTLVGTKRLASYLPQSLPLSLLRVQGTLRLIAERGYSRWMIARSLGNPHLGLSPPTSLVMRHYSTRGRVLSVSWSWKGATVKLSRCLFHLYLVNFRLTHPPFRLGRGFRCAFAVNFGFPFLDVLLWLKIALFFCVCGNLCAASHHSVSANLDNMNNDGFHFGRSKSSPRSRPVT